VLIPISLPSAGPGLLEAALQLAPRGRPLQIYAAHLQRSSDLSYTRSRLPGDEGALQPLLARAAERGVEVRPLSFTSTDIARDIRDLARVKRADLVVMGWHKPILRQGVLSGTVLSVMEQCTAEVAVFVERNAPPWHKILVPYRDMTTDRAALGVAARLASEPGIDATILHVVADRGAREGDAMSETAFPDGVRLKVVDSNDPVEAAVREAREGYDLIVVGVAREWGTAPAFPFIFGQRHEALARNSTASLLVVRPKSAEPAAAPANRRSAA
jgi:K+:H+ antiporter